MLLKICFAGIHWEAVLVV